MNPINRILSQNRLVILDGALATELERAGCDLDDSLWSAKVLMEAPELIKAVHRDYLIAGADCLITASYQATFEGFMRRGLTEPQAVDLMQLSVQLAIEARDEFWADPNHHQSRSRPIVAASIGPYGAFLADGSEYRGDYGLTKAELMAFHRPRMAVLADTDADMLACETIPCLLEAQAMAELLTSFPSVSAWLSFTAKNESHISHGERFVDCLAWLDDFPQIVAVGVNCTSPKYIEGLIQTARTITDKPIIVYPNSGEGYSVEKHHWTGPADTGNYGLQAAQWYAAGATIIGGCCRTTPKDIQQIATYSREFVRGSDTVN